MKNIDDLIKYLEERRKVTIESFTFYLDKNPWDTADKITAAFFDGASQSFSQALDKAKELKANMEADDNKDYSLETLLEFKQVLLKVLEDPTIENARDILDAITKKEADDGWISVEIETPPQRKDILIYHSGRYVVSGFRDGDGYYTYAVINYDNERVEIDPIGPGRVSHWKTLPNPPKDKQS